MGNHFEPDSEKGHSHDAVGSYYISKKVVGDRGQDEIGGIEVEKPKRRICAT